MHVDVLTLFPEMFAGPLGQSILKRAIDRELLAVGLTNPRDFTHDRHRTVDDAPYGGGPGMVMKPGPLFAAVESVARPDSPVVLLSPRGRVFSQEIARELARHEHLIRSAATTRVSMSGCATTWRPTSCRSATMC